MGNSDLISRAALLRRINEFGPANASTVINAPGIEAAPVVHGQWIDREGPDEDGNVAEWCSNCGHSDTHSPTVKVPFRWFRGAKMEGAEQ